MAISRTALLLAAILLAACTKDAISPAEDLQETLEYLRISRHIGHVPVSTTTNGNYTSYRYNPLSPVRCLDGKQFVVTVKKGESKNVLLYLEGGGACWDYESCYVNPLAPPKISRELSSILRFEERSLIEGRLYQDNPENPLADWNLVFASYCDGSKWMGDVDAVYDENMTFHHGFANLSAAVTLLKDHFSEAPKIMVAGNDAGGYGTLLGFMVLRSQFPTTPLYIFNYGGAWLNDDVNDPATSEATLTAWGIEQFYPPDCIICDEQLFYVAEYLMNRDSNSRWGYSYDERSYMVFEMTEVMHHRHPEQFKSIDESVAYRKGLLPSQWIADMVSDSPDWADLRR